MSEQHVAESICKFDSVSKWYGPVIGVNDVSLELQPGITGLVGHNGAGKSTLIKLLTGQLRPSLGQVRVAGRHSWSSAAKRHVGYCADVDAFYEEMSGRAFVRFIARLHGFGRAAAADRADHVIEQVGMSERADRKLGGYSKGMRQRVKLAQALVHDPDLIVLDEPLNGVDPVGRLEMTQLFRELVEQGKAILLSSHILDEMDKLADRILFICRGRILASGSLEEIRAMLADHPMRIRIGASNVRELAVELMRLPMVNSVELDGAELLLEVDHPDSFFQSFADAVVRHAVEIERLEVVDASTEAVFDYLMELANRPR
jgi:ABC-2 type transport system ATP-binding protein